jgi:hypothetical protein
MRLFTFFALAFCLIALPALGATQLNTRSIPVTAPQPAPVASAPPASAPETAKPPEAAIPAIGTFPVLPYGAADNQPPLLVPVASNHALDGNHATLTRAIIVIHDTARDASAALAGMMALAGEANASTLIIAPQFLLDSDIAHFADHLPDRGKGFARWPLGGQVIDGWQTGGDSAASTNGGPQKGISSFTVIDLLLLFLADRQNFPALKDVVIAGYGAGGDFVARYAAAGQAPDLLEAAPMPVRFLVADASSYLYPTATRGSGGRQGFVRPDATQCPDFDVWPYGLERLNAYAKRAGGNAIKMRLPARFITYIANPPGGKTAKADAFPDLSCAAALQGADRAARAANYRIYLTVTFGELAQQTQNFAVLPKPAPDAVGFFGSACGMSVLFGNGACAP